MVASSLGGAVERAAHGLDPGVQFRRSVLRCVRLVARRAISASWMASNRSWSSSWRASASAALTGRERVDDGGSYPSSEHMFETLPLVPSTFFWREVRPSLAGVMLGQAACDLPPLSRSRAVLESESGLIRLRTLRSPCPPRPRQLAGAGFADRHPDSAGEQICSALGSVSTWSKVDCDGEGGADLPHSDIGNPSPDGSTRIAIETLPPRTEIDRRSKWNRVPPGSRRTLTARPLMVVVQGAMSSGRGREREREREREMTASGTAPRPGGDYLGISAPPHLPCEQRVRHEAVAARRKEAKSPHFVWLVERMLVVR